MMKNYGQSAEINYNPNWPYIPYIPVVQDQEKLMFY